MGLFARNSSSKDKQKTTRKPPLKQKPQKRAKSSSFDRPKVLVLVFLVSSSVLVVNHYMNLKEYLPSAIQLKFLQLFGSKQAYAFKQKPVPSFNISRGVDRRSNLSLEEFSELYDAKWYVVFFFSFLPLGFA